MTDRRVWFWLGGLALALLLLYLLRGILLPFVAGMAIAYLLDPICDRLEKWGCSRTIATLLVVAAFLLLCAAVLLLLIPLLQSQIVELIARLPELIAALGERVRPLLQRLEPHLGTGDSSQVGTVLRSQAGGIVSWLGGATGAVLSGSIALANVLALIFITPVVTFYLLRDWDRLIGRIDTMLPREHAGVIREQAREIDRTLAGYVRGQALVCLFLGSFYAIGLTLAGLDFGLSVGLLTGILSFIPYVGTIVGLVTSMGLAFFQFSDGLSIGIVAAIFVAGQFIEGNFLQPKLVGERVGLHPVWVIFALLAGGALFGFVGVLLGLPVAAMVGVLMRFAQRRYLESRYYRGERAATLIVPEPQEPGRLRGSEDRDPG